MVLPGTSLAAPRRLVAELGPPAECNSLVLADHFAFPFLLLVPHAVEVGIGAVLRQQFIVRADFEDLAVVENDDARGVADGGEAVGDDKRGAVLRSRLRARWMTTSVWVSTYAVASSRMRMRGAARMARAKLRSCRWPTERFRPRCWSTVS